MLWTIISLLIFAVFAAQVPKIFKRNKKIKRSFLMESKMLQYVEPHLITESTISGYNNKVYQYKDRNTVNGLDTYMISIKNNKTYLSCKFHQEPDQDSMLQVKFYNEKYEYSSFMNIIPKESINQLSMCLLQKGENIMNVSLVSKDSQKKEIDIALDDKYQLQKELLLKQSVSLSLLMIPVAYLILYIITGDRLIGFMNGGTFLLGGLLILSVVFANYGLTIMVLHFRNRKGVKEYE